MADPRYYLLWAGSMGLPNSWGSVLPSRYHSRCLCLVYLIMIKTEYEQGIDYGLALATEQLSKELGVECSSLGVALHKIYMMRRTIKELQIIIESKEIK